MMPWLQAVSSVLREFLHLRWEGVRMCVFMSEQETNQNPQASSSPCFTGGLEHPPIAAPGSEDTDL